MNYLVYDCEVANSFDGISKICSLGYVLVDNDFNILKKEDILLNPEDKFDYHLYNNTANIRLYYPRSIFYSSPSFKERYEYIKQLFDDSDIVVGFSIENDIKFILDACMRYNCENINFKYVDVQKLFKLFYNDTQDRSLDYCVSFFNIDTEMVLHKSDDDAYLTFMVLKRLLEVNNLTFFSLLEKCNVKLTSIEDFLLIQEKRKLKKLERKQAYLNKVKELSRLNDLYDKEKENGGKLKGKTYCFTKNAFSYIEEALNIQKYIYDNGGVTKKHYEDGMYIIIDNPAEINDKIPNAKFVLINDLK